MPESLLVHYALFGVLLVPYALGWRPRLGRWEFVWWFALFAIALVAAWLISRPLGFDDVLAAGLRSKLGLYVQTLSIMTCILAIESPRLRRTRQRGLLALGLLVVSTVFLVLCVYFPLDAVQVVVVIGLLVYVVRYILADYYEETPEK